MMDWLRRYCTVDEGRGYDLPFVTSAMDWVGATDRKTLVAVRPPPGWFMGGDLSWGAASPGVLSAIRAVPTEDPIECDLADLLRFCGYIQREACETCFPLADVERLYEWTLTRPRHVQIGQCVDCWGQAGWITPAAPCDTRKAIVAGVLVCMSRLAWSIPPEVMEPGARVQLWRGLIGSLGGRALRWALVLDDAAGQWRVIVAGCDLVDSLIIPPAFYPDPLFAQLWQASRDDRAALFALRDWLSDRDDPYAEVLP